MEAVGDFLSRIGPVFPIILLFLVVTSSVTMVLMSLLRLARRDGASRGSAEPARDHADAEPGTPPAPSEAPPAVAPSHA